MNDRPCNIEIAVLWRADCCPVVDGIILRDGRVRKAIIAWDYAEPEHPVLSIQPGNWTRLAEIDATTPLNSTGLISLCEVIDNHRNLRVQGGEGGYGSDGFVAVDEADSGELLWIAFLTQSNPFVSVELCVDEIIATTNLNTRWRFPLDSPGDFDFQPNRQST